jgi:thiamine-phosphate pyrophosphorylase
VTGPLPALNAILDFDVAEGAGWSIPALADAYLEGGARFLQLRAKDTPGGILLETATAVVELARTAGALVVVNDRADIARLSGADGVHVGQEDIAPADARRILGREAVVGVSTHNIEQLDRALAARPGRPTYVAIGPVFGTATKATGYADVGLDMVRRAARRTREAAIPLVAIGGITLDTAADVITAGAASVAVISDLLATGDPRARVKAYVDRLTL